MSLRLYSNPAQADGKPCPYCRRTMRRSASVGSGLYPTKDHIRPKARGGILKDNKLICCEGCNNDKSDRLLWEWRDQLILANDPRSVYVTEVIVSLYRKLGHEAYGASVGKQSDGVWNP